LFSDKRGNVGFEKASTQPSDDYRNDKRSSRIFAVFDDSRDSRDDEDDVANESNGNGNADSVESPQISISNPCAKEWGNVTPSRR
jgi:hypothetical protein